MFTQIAMIAYMIRLRPFKSELQEVIAVTDEFTIIFGLILLYFLYLNQENLDTSQKLGMTIVGILVMSMIKNMSVIFYLSITGTYKKIRSWVHKKLKIEEVRREKRRLARRKIRQEKEKAEEMKKVLELIRMENLSAESIVKIDRNSKLDQNTSSDFIKKVETPQSCDFENINRGELPLAHPGYSNKQELSLAHLGNHNRGGTSLAHSGSKSLVNNSVSTDNLKPQIKEETKRKKTRSKGNVINQQRNAESSFAQLKNIIDEQAINHKAQLETIHDIEGISSKSIPGVEKDATG